MLLKPLQGKSESVWPQNRLLLVGSDLGSEKPQIRDRSHLPGLNSGWGHSFRPHRHDQVILFPPKGASSFKKADHFCLWNLCDPLACFWKNLVTPSPHFTQNVRYVTQNLIFNLLRIVSAAQPPLSSTIVPFLFMFQFTAISRTNKV